MPKKSNNECVTILKAIINTYRLTSKFHKNLSIVKIVYRGFYFFDPLSSSHLTQKESIIMKAF